MKIEVVPTSHAAYIRFTFPADAENANVIFDSLWGTGTLTFGEDGQSFKAQTNHTSAGGGKMYVVGRFDSAWAEAKTVGTKQGLVSFEKGTTVVTMKIATSFLSYEQAERSMALEIGSKDFKGVFAEAQGAWDALCGRFEIEGASFTQLQTFYSCLYRMYYGLYRMAEKMGLESQAEYYLNRCLKYVGLYNEEAGFFMGKSKDGVFSATAKNYDPAQWGGSKGDYTESVGWVNAFPAVFDGEGLVNLYGGREALAAKLNELFDDSMESMCIFNRPR